MKTVLPILKEHYLNFINDQGKKRKFILLAGNFLCPFCAMQQSIILQRINDLEIKYIEIEEWHRPECKYTKDLR